MGLSKIWALFLALKSNSYDKIVDLVLPPLFENPVVSKFLQNNKRFLGFLVTIAGLSLQEAAKFYPEFPFWDQTLPVWLIISGVVLNALGQAHAGSKDRRGVE